MKNKTFDEFLREWYMKDYRGTDDDAPDAFDEWIVTLEQNSLLSLAEVYGIARYGDGLKEAQRILRENAPSVDTPSIDELLTHLSKKTGLNI